MMFVQREIPTYLKVREAVSFSRGDIIIGDNSFSIEMKEIKAFSQT